jgi:Sensors of blue-light using FAD
MKLWTSLYVSRATADAVWQQADLDLLLARAQHYNALHGITGALLHYQGRFLQVLEGEQQTVHNCLARIAADPRHTAMQIVHQGPIAQRAFSRWSMKPIHTSPRHEPAVDDFWRRLAVAQERDASALAVTLLQRLVHDQPAA